MSLSLAAAVHGPARPDPAGEFKPWRRLLPGLLLCALLAAAAQAMSRWGWLQRHGVGTLTLAIVLACVVGNAPSGPWLSRLAAASGPGVGFARQTLLRAGIVLYGLRLTVRDISQVGAAGVVIDAVVVASTFALATVIGTRWLGVDRRLAMLIGAGSAVCGAAAVMAAEPVVRGRPEQVAVAVATVVVFGTLSMFLYPVLFTLNVHWPIVSGGGGGFGIYIGSTIHEVAQVVVAARSVDAHAADIAVIAKMVRVMMLAPFLVCVAAWLARGRSGAGDGKPGGQTLPRPGVAVPGFAVVFLAVVVANSLWRLPEGARSILLGGDTALLAMAMAALGLGTRVQAVREAGLRPLALAAILFAWLVVGGAWINRSVEALAAVL